MVSSGAYIWFGIPGRSMQWVPAPQAGFQRSWVGAMVNNSLADGRQDIWTSRQVHSKFEGTYFGDYNDPNGVNLDVFQAYASGFYGTGPITFANPYAFQQNLFAPHWATPGLAKYGWMEPIASVTNYPLLTVSNGRVAGSLSGPITTSVNVPNSYTNRYSQYIAIPPGYMLYVGWSGSATGTAGVMVQPYNLDNTLASATMLTPLSVTSTTQTNATFSGNSYNAVRVFMTRSSTATSTITLNSMMARLYPIGTTPPASYNHVPGQGFTGLMIAGDAIAETYIYAGVKKSLQLTLEEVI